MAEGEDGDLSLSDVLPPSPIALSSQTVHRQAARLPPLPQLPGLVDAGHEVMGTEPQPAARTSGISPLASSTQMYRPNEAERSAGIRRMFDALFATMPAVTPIRRYQGPEEAGMDDEIVQIEDSESEGSVFGGSENDVDDVSVPDVDEEVVLVDNEDEVAEEEQGIYDGPGEGAQGLAPGDTGPGPPADTAPIGPDSGDTVTASPQPGPSDVMASDASVPEATVEESVPRGASGEVEGSAGPTNTPQAHPALPQGVHIITPQHESPADFRSPKRRRIMSPPKPAVIDKPTEEEDDEAESCPICYESWTTSGNHRVSSLKCGHLFGQSCIQKWLSGQGGKCPQCNNKAKRQDIRVIYARSIRALDTTERDRALKDLEKEKESRRKCELEGAQLRLQYQLAVEDCNRLRGEVESLKSQVRQNRVSSTSLAADLSQSVLEAGKKNLSSGQFVCYKTIKISETGKCRVMAYSGSLATMVVSQPSSSQLFPGFGIRKISTLDMKTSQYLTIHAKPIRDMAFHPTVENGLLLSCGLDNKVKLTSLHSNAIVQVFELPLPAWSCVWNADDQNYLYVGLQNGLVQEFDVRNTESAVQEINTAGSRSPVASLQYMPRKMDASFRTGGLLVGQLDRVTFVEILQNQDHRLHFMPLEGSVTSLNIEPKTRHILASFRPTAKHATSRHQMCEMIERNLSISASSVEKACTCNVVQSFNGGRLQTVLSRTLLMPHPADSNSLLVCAGDEANNKVNVWDTGTVQLKQRLSTGGITLDTHAVTINNDIYLAALTERQLTMFKWSE